MLTISKLLIRAARIQDESLRRRSSVLNILFFVTFGVLSLAALGIIIVYISGNNRLVLHRLFSMVLALGFIGALYAGMRRGHYFIAASGLLGVYWLLATIMALEWGTSLPISLLVYCTLIVLAGIVLGAAYSLVFLVLSGLVLFLMQTLIVTGIITPNLYWQSARPQMADLVSYYFVFTVLGVSSWLFNRQTDQSLHRALRAEAALQREKQLLELKVEQRTRELEAAQIDKMQQMYRFAQLGQFSTSLLHDLGNHIATISLDIEGMAEQKKLQTRLQQRIKRRIGYVDDMVQWAYEHINGRIQSKQFSINYETREIVKILQYDARTTGIELHDLPKNTTLTLYGDPARFRQIIANLVTNAVAAYDPTNGKDSERGVWITGEQLDDETVRLVVRDHGRGIPAENQAKIFDPFYSTRHNGTGIGLFVVKQIVEEYFNGMIAVESQPGDTRFIVTLRTAQHGAD